jgi:hypothetical protein
MNKENRKAFEQQMQDAYSDLADLDHDQQVELLDDVQAAIEDVDAALEAYGNEDPDWRYRANRKKYHLIKERNWLKRKVKKVSETKSLKYRVHCLTQANESLRSEVQILEEHCAELESMTGEA